MQTRPNRAAGHHAICAPRRRRTGEWRNRQFVPQTVEGIRELESGEHAPYLDTLVRLADALEIEFLVDITPSGKSTSWVSPRAAAAKVVEKVRTGKGGELLVAAG